MQPYLPREHFKVTDDDFSSVRIRDMPYGKQREALSLTPSGKDFGNMVLGRVSPPETFLLTNIGYDQVLIQEIVAVGDFAFTGPEINHVNIGETVSLSVCYTPAVKGLVTGGLYVTAPNALGSKFASLTGSGVTIEDLLMQYPLLSNGKVTGPAIAIANGVYSCAVSGTFDGATAQLEWRPDAATPWISIPNIRYTEANTIYGIPLNIGQTRILIIDPGFSTSLTATLMW